MMSRSISQLVILLTVFAIGCGSAERPTREDANRSERPVTPRTLPLAEVERTLQPSRYDEDPAETVKKQRTPSEPASSDVPDPSTRIEEEIRQGFRIQILSTSSINDANRERLAAAQKLPQDSVYIVFDPPVYKVRVGDFRTRLDANRMLPVCVSAGYEDAWVVSDRITLRKRVEIRQEEQRQ
ncbi:MAG: SPOR domain-containing protein [Ignavibacteria bacterium]|nr:SPOR domain-containing protein [Ignavibacteria bacterium]